MGQDSFPDNLRESAQKATTSSRIILITGALRTAPTNALLVLAEPQPINYCIERKTAIEFTKLYASSRLSNIINPDEALERHLNSETHRSSLQHALSTFSQTQTALNLNHIEEELLSRNVDPTISPNTDSIIINDRETAKKLAREVATMIKVVK